MSHFIPQIIKIVQHIWCSSSSSHLIKIMQLDQCSPITEQINWFFSVIPLAQLQKDWLLWVSESVNRNHAVRLGWSGSSTINAYESVLDSESKPIQQNQCRAITEQIILINQFFSVHQNHTTQPVVLLQKEWQKNTSYAALLCESKWYSLTSIVQLHNTNLYWIL